MTTLFDRLVGLNLQDSNGKMGIHAFCGAIDEFSRGYETGANIVSAFDLTEDQTGSAIALKAMIDAAPQPVVFMRVFKNWLYIGEMSTDPGSKYLDQAQFVQRLQNEIIDQGGTPP